MKGVGRKESREARAGGDSEGMCGGGRVVRLSVGRRDY
jgi:ribosomal protein L4